MLQLSISYLSFEQPAGEERRGEESSLRAGQVLGLALLCVGASGAAASSCLPSCTGGTERHDPNPGQCSPWSGSHHTCGSQILFKIWIIPRAAAASPLSKSKPVRSPAYKNPSVLPSGGRMWLKSSPAKMSKHSPGPKWSDQRKGVCMAMGPSARSRGLHGLQECFCGDVSVNSTQDLRVSCEQE